MKISIIGSGNVGSHLAKKLFSLKHDIVEVYSHTFSNAEALAQEVSAQPLRALKDLSPDVHLVAIAVPDDHIAEVSDALPELDALLVHTSGSVDSTALDKHQRYGVFYPMQTFKKDQELSWEGLPCFLYANNAEDLKLLQTIAAEAMVKHTVLDDAQRAALHIAAVFANNYTNHMLVIAEGIMKANKLDYNLLKPLIRRTFDHDRWPSEVQTGPAQRGDEKTLEKQLTLLEYSERYQTIYAMIAASIVEEKKRNEQRDS